MRQCHTAELVIVRLLRCRRSVQVVYRMVSPYLCPPIIIRSEATGEEVRMRQSSRKIGMERKCPGLITSSPPETHFHISVNVRPFCSILTTHFPSSFAMLYTNSDSTAIAMASISQRGYQREDSATEMMASARKRE